MSGGNDDKLHMREHQAAGQISTHDNCTVNLNVDASFNTDLGSRGPSTIIRDESVHFIAASYRNIPFVHTAMSAEVGALRDRLIFASNIGCNKLISEAGYLE